MPRRVSPSVVAILVGIVGTAARAQPIRVPTPPPTDELTAQLQTCREGILDTRARPDERRRWVDLLFSYDSAQARPMIVELISLSGRPEVQAAVCGGLADQARKNPDRLDAAFVEPLMGILGAESDELRAAAARALAEFPIDLVATTLAERAARADVPMPQRLAAIDALAPNTHHREVVARLIGLLEMGVPEITDRVAVALEPIAMRALGRDAAAWRAWWEEKARLSEKEWLAYQLRVYRDRSRKLAIDLQIERAELNQDRSATTAKIRDFQRELIRSLPAEQRDARLVEWIDDPLSAVKLAALGLVKARIADEGKRPEGEVLAALLRLLQHESPAMRREALQILQNLSDEGVLTAVLGRLEEEKDPATRHALLTALGKIGNPAAIPAMVREIGSPESPPECVREAAAALGQLVAKLESKDALPDAVKTLLERYRGSSLTERSVRAALLTAMAGLADASFTPLFLEAVESDDVGILQAALNGLRAVGEASKVGRCRTLISHPDPRVRLAAIEAVAQLGREDADLEALLARVNPVVESNELARDAAWRGSRQLLAARPIPQRIRVVDRLRDMPDLSIKYMEELIASLASSPNNVAELDAMRDRLAAALMASGRFAEAVPHLRELYAVRAARGDESAKAVGLRWLEAILESPAPAGCAEAIVRLAETSGDVSIKADIVRLVGAHLDDASNPDAQRARSLLAELRAVPIDLLGDPWGDLMARATNSTEPRE